jgi:simple sugar transport system ATP-binding protein
VSFALELSGITVQYGALAANRDARLQVRAGTVHALVGENGAGKSTLLKVAYGEARAAAGTLRIGGADVALGAHTPAGAIGRGLGMVHQHFMLVPPLTVAENVVLGREPIRRVGGVAVLDLAEAATQIGELSGRLGMDVDPTRRVDALSVGEQQRVEIVKVLWRGADVLLLDEPTAVLAPHEV